MATSYDLIWTEFITNCKTDNINLPNTPEKMYDIIHSAIRHFNTRINDDITCDDTNEQISRDLLDNELIMVAHYIRLSFFENQLISLTTIWQPFQKEIGIRNYQEQSRNIKELISSEKDIIESIITNSFDDELM